ncbi:MAG: ComEC/Rec2 family competence protein [Cyclobacteriaceae bacterium]
MNIWNAFPFVRYAVALILGILLYFGIPEIWDYYQVILIALILLVFVTAFFFRARNLGLFRVLSGLFTLALIAFLGGLLAQLNNERKAVNHYHHVDEEIVAFSGVINSDHFEREKYFRYEFQLEQVLTETRQQKVSGSIYLYQRKDSLASVLPYGTQLFVHGSFFEIESPKNPDEFNYKRYLVHRNIFAHAFVSYEDFEIVGEGQVNPILDLAYRVRTSSSQMISDYIPGVQEAAVLNALLIGVKDYLDNEIKDAYSAAGAMHVLAVSGLHVGIVYLLITLVFGSLKSTGWGKVVFVAIALGVIWCYALITGFSPSVMRASTMFSVIILAETSKKKSNIYNSLGLAAFILLMYNPYFIFDVGFQLSFIAVLGIVMLQPPIYRLLSMPNKLLDYCWAIISVSIAAQIVTFPLSILYFHQFPTYFLLSNLLIIPSSMVMLTTGLFMLGVGCFSDIAGETIGFLLGSFVKWINWLILWIQTFPFPTIDWLYLSGLSVLLLYLFMVYFYQALKHFHFNALIFSMVCMILLMINIHVEDYMNSTQERVVVYHTRDGLAIDLINGKSAQLLTFGSSGQELIEMASFNIDPHRLVSGLKKVGKPLEEIAVISDEGLHFIVWKGMKILVVESATKRGMKQDLEIDLTILQCLDKQLMEDIQSKKIVIGPMRSFKDRAALINYLEGRNISYFDTNEAGAFILHLSNYTISD